MGYTNSENKYGYQKKRTAPGGKFNPPTEIPKEEPIPENYLERAEEIMAEHFRKISTSKIRRLFSSVIELYNEEILRTEKELLPDSVAAIAMMRVRFAYECGRDNKVKEFVKNAHLINYLKSIGNSREAFIKFAQYMEALVAYHKFFGGREN